VAKALYGQKLTQTRFRLSQTILGDRSDGSRRVARVISVIDAPPREAQTKVLFFTLTPGLQSLDSVRATIGFLSPVPKVPDVIEVPLTIDEIQSGETVDKKVDVQDEASSLPPQLMTFSIEQVGDQVWQIVKAPVELPISMREISNSSFITSYRETSVVDLNLGRVTAYEYQMKSDSWEQPYQVQISMREVSTRKLEMSEMTRLNQEALELIKIQQAAQDAPDQAEKDLKAFETKYPDSAFRAGHEDLRYTLNRMRAGLAQRHGADATAASMVGKASPDFSLPDIEGVETRFSRITKGKVTLLSFWGCGCGPCRAEAPHLTALQKKYRDRGFTVVAVNGYEESQAMVKKFAVENQLTHPILINGSQTARELYGVGVYPTSFWIDAQGMIVGAQTGFEPGMEEQIEKQLLQLLPPPPNQGP
jgi:thiol-disulfide isomerase/thioredoxin